jgi:hypothetical protein
MAQEKNYLNALTAAESYQIREGKLHIACAGDRALAFGVAGD